MKNWSYGGNKPVLSYGGKKPTMMRSSAAGSNSSSESRTGGIMTGDCRKDLTEEDNTGQVEDDVNFDTGEELNSSSSEGKINMCLLSCVDVRQHSTQPLFFPQVVWYGL